MLMSPMIVIQFTILKMLNLLQTTPTEVQMSELEENKTKLTLFGSVDHKAINTNILQRIKTVTYMATPNALNSNWNWNLSHKLIANVMWIMCLKFLVLDVISLSMLTHAANISTNHTNYNGSYSNRSTSSNINITTSIGDHDMGDGFPSYTTTADPSSSGGGDFLLIGLGVAGGVIAVGVLIFCAINCKFENDRSEPRDTEKQLSAAMENNEDNNEYDGWEEWNEEETTEWVKLLLINDNIDDDAINTFLHNDFPHMTGATMLKMKKNERLLKSFEQRGSNKSFAMFVAISAAIENLPWPGDDNQQDDQEEDQEDDQNDDDSNEDNQNENDDDDNDEDDDNQDNNYNDDEDDEYYDN